MAIWLLRVDNQAKSAINSVVRWAVSELRVSSALLILKEVKPMDATVASRAFFGVLEARECRKESALFQSRELGCRKVIDIFEVIKFDSSSKGTLTENFQYPHRRSVGTDGCSGDVLEKVGEWSYGLGRIRDVGHGGGTGSRGCAICCKGIKAVASGNRFCDDLMGNCSKKLHSLLSQSWLNSGDWLPILPFGWGGKEGGARDSGANVLRWERGGAGGQTVGAVAVATFPQLGRRKWGIIRLGGYLQW
jgi:hypothetical protein